MILCFALPGLKISNVFCKTALYYQIKKCKDQIYICVHKLFVTYKIFELY